MTAKTTLTRAEKLTLAAAALRGILAGTARAALPWLIELIGQHLR